MTMHMTEEGYRLIMEFEGFRANAYRDPVGIWTVGYGHTAMAGPPDVKPGLVITQHEARRILERDVERFADAVRDAVKVSLSPQQFSALVSFTYNVGPANFRRSGVLKAVNAGAFNNVPRRLGQWNKAGGRILPGLVRRRAAEGAMFMAEGTAATVSARARSWWLVLLEAVVAVLNRGRKA